jgi:hypothetical protein
MKLIYILAAILACNTLGLLSGNRTVKAAMLLISALLAAYGIWRLIG